MCGNDVRIVLLLVNNAYTDDRLFVEKFRTENIMSSPFRIVIVNETFPSETIHI